eukprot:10579921-Lingulodinium_polyedra.AAC.1
MAMHGMAMPMAMAWECMHCMVWHGMAWYGMVWHCMAWPGMAWHGMAWHSMAWHGTAWHVFLWSTKANLLPKHACPPVCGLAAVWGQRGLCKAGQAVPLLAGLSGRGE